jgi:hypothetical protein
VQLLVDITGVGRPVVELIETALSDRHVSGCDLIGVTFTFGQKWERSGFEATLGKGFLVSRLQSLLQTERLRLPRTPEAESLAAELVAYEIRVDQDGDAKFGAFRVGSHDDLVTALGLAVVDEPTDYGRPTLPPHGVGMRQFQL